MAKLEELSELLVSEIRDFEEAVKRLEEIQNAKIGLDVTELKNLLLNHEQVIKNQTSTVQDVEKQFRSLIKEAKIYPRWAVIIFIISLMLNFILIAALPPFNIKIGA